MVPAVKVFPTKEPSIEAGATVSLRVPRGPPDGEDRAMVRVPLPPSGPSALTTTALLTVTFVNGSDVAPLARLIGPAVVSEMVGVSGSVVWISNGSDVVLRLAPMSVTVTPRVVVRTWPGLTTDGRKATCRRSLLRVATLVAARV
jgi:hypothetical protein